MPTFSFDELPTAHLIRNAIYEGGPTKDFSDDPIPPLVKGKNVGGFRKTGPYAVLYTNGIEPNWPDELSIDKRQFIYHGDRRKPDGDLHSTPGNRFLEAQYQFLSTKQRAKLLPTFIFQKANGSTPRAVQFLGLAIFGAANIPDSDVLSTYWCRLNDQKFLNYRVIYTILNEEFVSREWLTDVLNSTLLTVNTPVSYRKFVEGGEYN